MEKKWSPKDFDERVRQFKFSKRRRVGGNSMMNMSMDDADNIGNNDFENESEEEDEAEFEAKRAKDAENKVIQDIFGGKVIDL